MLLCSRSEGVSLGHTMSAPVNKSINLIIKEGFEHTQLGKLLDWLLSAGRTIVVITELIVIAAFLSRFWLDRTLADLNEQNTAKKNQIEASLMFEKDFRNIQTRLTLYKSIDAGKTNAVKLVKDITSLLPSGVILSNISFSENQLTLRGNSLSEGGVAGFVIALDKSDYKNSVLSEVSIETAGQQTISFIIKVPLFGKDTNNGS